MEIVAVGIEPGLGTLDMAADFSHDFPEPRRMVHLDEMGDFVGREVVEHVRRREDQPPGERQRAGRGARTPAARLVADREPPDLDAKLLRIRGGCLLQILAGFSLEKIMNAPLGMFDAARYAEDALAAVANLGPDRAALTRAVHDSMGSAAERHHCSRKKGCSLGQSAETSSDPAAVTLRKVLGIGDRAARRDGEDRLAVARMNS